jgi:hypothetical protein
MGKSEQKPNKICSFFTDFCSFFSHIFYFYLFFVRFSRIFINFYYFKRFLRNSLQVKVEEKFSISPSRFLNSNQLFLLWEQRYFIEMRFLIITDYQKLKFVIQRNFKDSKKILRKKRITGFDYFPKQPYWIESYKIILIGEIPLLSLKNGISFVKWRF